MNDHTNEASPSEELMAKIAKGDSSAFEILVRRHQHSVLNFIYRFIGDRVEAEDLAQELFLRVWRSAATYKPKAKFTTWLYRITTNLCINKLKSARLRKWFIVSLSREERQSSEYQSFPERSEKAPSPEYLLLEAERKQLILNALQQLPTAQRMALILKRYDGLSYQEIAHIMGRSVSPIDSLMIRAKKNLRKKLTFLEKKTQVFRD